MTNRSVVSIAGYTSDDADRLEADIRTQLLPIEAIAAGQSEYGEKFIIRAEMTGPNGRTLKILSVWMLEKQLA